MHSVFQVENCWRLDEDQWYVIGRALDDIKLGDILISAEEYVGTDDRDVVPNEMPESGAFIVSKITLHNKSMEFVSKGFTAGITLKGKSELNKASRFYFKRPERHP